MARFATLYSGSSGNSAVICQETPAGGEFLLVDVGKNCKQTLLALQSLGLQPQGLCGILITHEHADHISGLRVFGKKHPVPVYASAATLAALTAQEAVAPGVPLVPMEAQTQRIAGFGVQAFAASHDAAGCCGFRVQCADGSRMGIVTDLGFVSPTVYDGLRGCGLVALESNYDRGMLWMGRYPYYLKSRIASEQGHLSNDDCAEAVAQLLAEGCTRFALCHLSRENNLPELARAAVLQRLQRDERFTPLQLAAGALTVQVSPRDAVSAWIDF